MKKNIGADNIAVGQFLSIVRYGLWGKNARESCGRTMPAPGYVPGSAPADWKGILHLARKQAVLPLLYDGLEFLPEDRRLQGPALLKLIAYVDRVEQHNRALDAAAVEISSRLSACGIDSVLLKGQGNALLYRNPLHRQCGDIDLYTGPENYGKAIDIIRSWKEISEEKEESVKHTGFSYLNLILELHKEAYFFPDRKSNRLYRPWEREELAAGGYRVKLGDAGEVTVPPVDFNLFYIFAHGFTHFMQSGLGLRQLCDLALFIHCHHGEFDTEALKARLKAFRLEKEWKLFVCFLVEILGLPEEEAPLYDPDMIPLSRKLLGQILADGNFGHHKDLPDFSGKPVLLRKIGNLGIHHIILARRLKFSPRQTFLYYSAMWRDGLQALSKLFSAT